MPLFTVKLIRVKCEEQEIWLFAKNEKEAEKFAKQRWSSGLDHEGPWKTTEETLDFEVRE